MTEQISVSETLEKMLSSQLSTVVDAVKDNTEKQIEQKLSIIRAEKDLVDIDMASKLQKIKEVSEELESKVSRLSSRSNMTPSDAKAVIKRDFSYAIAEALSSDWLHKEGGVTGSYLQKRLEEKLKDGNYGAMLQAARSTLFESRYNDIQDPAVKKYSMALQNGNVSTNPMQFDYREAIFLDRVKLIAEDKTMNISLFQPRYWGNDGSRVTEISLPMSMSRKKVAILTLDTENDLRPYLNNNYSKSLSKVGLVTFFNGFAVGKSYMQAASDYIGLLIQEEMQNLQMINLQAFSCMLINGRLNAGFDATVEQNAADKLNYLLPVTHKYNDKGEYQSTAISSSDDVQRITIEQFESRDYLQSIVAKNPNKKKFILKSGTNGSITYNNLRRICDRAREFMKSTDLVILVSSAGKNMLEDSILTYGLNNSNPYFYNAISRDQGGSSRIMGIKVVVSDDMYDPTENLIPMWIGNPKLSLQPHLYDDVLYSGSKEGGNFTFIEGAGAKTKYASTIMSPISGLSVALEA